MNPLRLRVLVLAAAAWLAAGPALAIWWGPTADSAKPAKPIAVDGKSDDWDLDKADDSDGFTFSFANDDKNLYAVFEPHTRGTKDQISGRRGQNLTVWFDAKAAKNKSVGIRLHAPPAGGAAADRSIEFIGIDTAAYTVSAAVGSVDQRGVLEASFPLKAFGSSPPEKITVGLISSEPTRGEARKRPARVKTENEDAESNSHIVKGNHRSGGGGDSGGDDEAETTSLWIKVTLAK